MIAALVAAVHVSALANAYVALRLEEDPTLGNLVALPADGTRLPDRSAAALVRFEARRDELLRSLQEANPAEDPDAYAVLLEGLESHRALRTCRLELWRGVSHIDGWEVVLPGREPADSRRWLDLPRFLSVEERNLRQGLRAGYSAPRPVVVRVLKQIEALDLPVPERVANAIRRYREFLLHTYLRRARHTLGVGSLPGGEQCYAALLRTATTRDRSDRETFALGERTVAATAEDLRKLGPWDVPANHFASSDEIRPFAQRVLDRAARLSAPLFFSVPAEPPIEPLPSSLQRSGVPSRYENGVFHLSVDPAQTRGALAVTVVHEAIPGHHLQAALARPRTALAKLSFNDAYVEGWANYAEGLAEEAGVFEDSFPRIFRRLVRGRSLVVDPGVHALGWDRARVPRAALDAARPGAQPAVTREGRSVEATAADREVAG